MLEDADAENIGPEAWAGRVDRVHSGYNGDEECGDVGSLSLLLVEDEDDGPFRETYIGSIVKIAC